MKMAHFFNVTSLVELLDRNIAERTYFTPDNLEKWMRIANTYECKFIAKAIMEWKAHSNYEGIVIDRIYDFFIII